MECKDCIKSGFLLADLVANHQKVRCQSFHKCNPIKVVKELIPKTYLDLEKLIISMSGALRLRNEMRNREKKRRFSSLW